MSTLTTFLTINAAGARVAFLINMSDIHFDYVSTSLPFVRERICKKWTRLHTPAKKFSENYKFIKPYCNYLQS